MFRRLLRVALKDRINIECCDSTYGALVYRKIAEGCSSTVKCTVLMSRKVAECGENTLRCIDG
jgi:hypothetical protein